jgi:outer membrane protein assembly factor BamB
VFVWIERQAEPYVLAIDKATGKQIWKVEGLGAASWSTPALVTVGDKSHLVLSGSGKLAGLDPETGKRLWTFDGLAGNTIPTPQVLRNGEFLIGATVARGEEGGGRAAASNGMIAIRESSPNVFQTVFKWRCQRATSSFGSPIVHDGLTYFVNATGVMFCIDAETGVEVYSERLAESCWATPLAIGDRIYFAGKSGTTTVVQAGRQYQKLAENRLWQDLLEQPKPSAEKNAESPKPAQEQPRVVYAIMAISNQILIRSGDTLFCLKDLR